MMKRMVTPIFQHLINVLTRTTNANLHRKFTPYYLSRISQPGTVIDVGVGAGSESLCRAFPDAKFILVEPLRENEAAIDRITRNLDCTIYYKALSDERGQREMHVDINHLETSSFEERTTPLYDDSLIHQRSVDVTTLDSIFTENQDMKSPILLKMDTEGHELKILEGAQDSLHLIDTVIAEVTIARRFKGSYSFEELIRFMQDNGFCVFDFLTITYMKWQLQPRFADVVFKRKRS